MFMRELARRAVQKGMWTDRMDGGGQPRVGHFVLLARRGERP